MKTKTTSQKNVIFASDCSVIVITVFAHDDDDAIEQAEAIAADQFGFPVSYNEVTVESAGAK